jgi:putative DNA primase/helicase
MASTNNIIELALVQPTPQNPIPTPEVVWHNGYEMRGDGLYERGKDEDGDERLAGPFEILGEARDVSSQDWGLAIRWRDRDGVFHDEIVPRADLVGDATDVFRMFARGGLELVPGNTVLKKIKEALHGVTCSHRVRLINRVGWHDTTFVLPHRSIGPKPEARGLGSNQPPELIRWSGASSAARFGEAGTIEQWRESVAALAASNDRLVFALSVAFSGPLADLIGEPGSGFHLRGASSGGKTTALVVAGSVWGGGGPNGFVGSWRATANGLESLAAAHSGTCLILDELAEIDPREAAAAVYALANGRGKARMSKTLEMRQRSEWRVPLLSSGEIGLADKIAEEHHKTPKAGLDVRLVDIRADAGTENGVFNVLHGRASGAALSNEIRAAALECYGVVGPAFVAEIVSDIEKI